MRALLVSLALWWLLPAGAGAAQPMLELEALVDAALARHPLALGAAASVEAAEARAQGAASPYWPQLSANASSARTTNISPSQTSSAPFLLSAAGLQARLQLWDFGKTDAEVRAAQAQAEGLRAEAALAAVEVAFGVRRAHAAWVAARAALAAAEQNLAGAARTLGQAEAFWRAGRRAKIEAVRARAEREAALAEQVAARAGEAGARRAMAAALALEELPAGEPRPEPLPAVATRPLPELVARAFAHHPGLRGATSRRTASDARAAGAALAGWPDVMADGNYGLRVRDEAAAQLWSTGISLSLPLFTGFAQQRQWEAAAAEARAAAAQVAERRQAVRLGVEQAWLALQGARERLPAAAARAQAARENWRLASGRYAAGVGSALEVADARTLLAGAEVAEVRAAADLARAVAELWRALGETGRPGPQAGGRS